MKILQMNKIAVYAFAAAILAAATGAQAANVNNNFNVIINLTPSCTISTAPGDIVLNYTDGGAAVNNSTSVGVTCTNLAPYTLSMDGLVGAGTYSFTDADTGLPYTMSFTAAGTGGADLVTAGTGAEDTHPIGANIIAGQSGTCLGGACNSTNNEVHTVYVNY